ncbi:MAG: peptidylprolyl isomerase [Methyloprofundus sp.]|nr:peptidylprolyl isomerase [Methyloprofundus sp.]
MKQIIKKITYIVLLVTAFNVIAADYLDGIAAIVEDDIILDSELVSEVQTIVARLQQQKIQLPEKEILYKQVLERLIVDKLQTQLAQRAGMKVSDEYVNLSIEKIARSNRMNMETFKASLAEEGMSFTDFQENVRKEITINQLRSREIGARIKISDQAVKHYLETTMSVADRSVQYLVGHILLSLPEGADAKSIQQKTGEANDIVQQLKSGTDFKQLSVAKSESDTALKGGDLGWRTLNQLPSLFVDTVKGMQKGDVADPIRSPSGFHILQLLDSSGNEAHIITETHVRHILIKTNELIDDNEAKKRLQSILSRIEDGDDFAVLAKANSKDTGSAIKGGDLSWVVPGLLVPPFEKAMNDLALNEISEPVQTQFGWHIIQVLARRTKDNTEKFKFEQARNELRKRKIEEETELWLRRLRDEAYVDIRLGMLNE